MVSDAPARLSLAVTSLQPGGGGIARVARLMASVLGGEANAGRMRVRAVSLYDEGATADGSVSVVAAGGSRWRYSAAVHAAALRSTHSLSDSLAMVRAHNRLPLLRRPLLAWVHGIEVWEGARADRLAAASRTDLLVVNSAHTRERAERLHGGFARARVCWLGTESDTAPPPRRLDGPPVVLVLGRLEPGRDKGHHALIDSWPNVVSAVPQARLRIVGGGPDLNRIRDLAGRSPAAVLAGAVAILWKTRLHVGKHPDKHQ